MGLFIYLQTFGDTIKNMSYTDTTIWWAGAHQIKRTSERRSPEHAYSLARVGGLSIWALSIALLLVPFLAQSKRIHSDSTTPHLETPAQNDTIIIIQKILDDKAVNAYIEILEKTNSQLSLWWSPYGVFVTMLGVLFTVLAIISGFAIYRQGKEHKDLIKESVKKHQTDFANLIDENRNLLKKYQISLDEMISEHKERLANAPEEDKEQISNSISTLEKQKEYVDPQLNTYQHSGWAPKDIAENYFINQFTNFYARIGLNQANQKFVIYIQIIASNKQKYWLGFSGDSENRIYKDKGGTECTVTQVYNTREVVIQKHISSYFKESFPNLGVEPLQVVCVRLRGGENDSGEIFFSYKLY